LRFDDLREEYGSGRLPRGDVPSRPAELFERWLRDAIGAGLPEPNAMALATAGADGRPSVRLVLLKRSDDRGLVFATNYRSRKGAELRARPVAAVVFHWQPLERQVRIEGGVARCGEDESDDLWRERPRDAQLGAWASDQSRAIPDRAWLERRRDEAARRWPTEVPRPPHWGGYRLVPDRWEFWQGRAHRLHDRWLYEPDPAGGWRSRRLAP